MFVKWSDGVTSKTRTDTGFKQNLDVTAVFAAASVHISEGKASASTPMSLRLRWRANMPRVKTCIGSPTVRK